MRPPVPQPFRVTPVGFEDLPNWRSSDPRPALAAFRRSCAVIATLPAQASMGGTGYAGTAGAWKPVCAVVPNAVLSTDDARRFFENWFAPLAVGRGDDRRGLFTGYFEPVLTASPIRTARYRVPIYGLPQDLLTADLGQFAPDLAGRSLIGRIAGKKFVPAPTRAQIDAAGLTDAPIILYGNDPISIFFLQIEGSGRVRLPDGIEERLEFAGTNGQPYTPIGRVLLRRGALERGHISMQSIRTWLAAHPAAAPSIMESDRSFVFFKRVPLGDSALGGPGTEGVALTPGASLAIDPRFHPFGTPIYLATRVPDSDPAKPSHAYDRLLVAQDAGGAIKGAIRADVYFGIGAEAAAIAGHMASPGTFYVLVPKSVAARLAPFREFGGS